MIPSEWLAQWNNALPGHRGELILALGWIMVLLLMSVPKFRYGRMVPVIGIMTIALYLILSLTITYPVSSQFHTLNSDGISLGAKVIASLLSLLWLGWQTRFPENRSGEFTFLTLSILGGTVIAAEANHWITAILGLEIVSLSAYVLVAWRRQSPKAAEAALRYMLFGAISTAVMIYGVSWWYGHFGSLAFSSASTGNAAPMLWLMVLTGLLFKLGAVPMHFYLPETYEGMTWPLIGFLGVLPRIGAMAILYRLGIAIGDPTWDYLVAGIAGISMLWGTLAALRQEQVKRMIAFSGIAQSGYVLATGISRDPSLISAGFLYLGWYGLATALLALAMERTDPEGQRLHFSDWSGSGSQIGTGGVVIMGGMASLIGLPPMTGFVAKVVLGISLAGNETAISWLLLALILLSTVLSAFYYLRWGLAAYLRKTSEQNLPFPKRNHTILLIIVVIGLLIPTIWGFVQAHEWLSLLIGMNITPQNL